MKDHVKNLVRRVWTTPLYRRLLFALDWLAFKSVKCTMRSSRRTNILVLAPPTGENIGDQAMLESIVHHTSGPLTVVVTDPSTFVTYSHWSPRVRIVGIPGLIHRPPFFRFFAVVKFSKLLQGADQVLIPGADTLDGGHPHASLARLSLATVATRSGAPTRIQGFSWKSDPNPSVVVALANLQGRAVIAPRDPQARRRLAAVGITQTIQVADLAFCEQLIGELPPPIAGQVDAASAGAGYAVLNTSGLIHRTADLVEDYGRVLRWLHGHGLKVVFLPHVIRDWDDDLALASSVKDTHGTTGDVLVEQLLQPSQVRGLVRDAKVVITGRMHLAILSLSQGTPAVCLATHGKVEGLFELVDLPGLVVSPRAGCADGIVEVAEDVLARRKEIVDHITSRLPEIRALSARNFV